MQQFMDEKIGPWATRIGNNKVLSSISNGFNMIMPIILIGAFFTFFATFNVEAYQSFLVSSGLKEVLNIIPMVTTSLLSLYVVFAIAYQYAKTIGMKEDAGTIGLLALLIFFVITPLTQTNLTSALLGTENIMVYTFDWFGGTGLFSAIILGILVPLGYRLIVSKGWTIKMPDGVPDTISKSFSALIPFFILVTLALFINYGLSFTPFEYFHQVIYGILLLPLQSLTDNIFTIILILILMHFFWFFGMHGTLILGPVLLAVLMPATLENTNALAAGQPIPNIFSLASLSVIAIGGIGATLPLVISMLFAKSDRYKTFSKLAIVPSLVGINEPVIFGFPIMLNPMMFIPFMSVPIVNMLILYFAILMGFVSAPALINLPTGTPVFVEGFVQMGVNGVLLQLIMFVVSFAIYYPFARYLDQQEYKKEQELND